MTTAGELSVGLALPGEPQYDAAAAVFNLAAPAHPEAAIIATDVEQVRAAIRHAAERQLPVRVHTTGHASGATRPVTDGLLIRTELTEAEQVRIDPERRMARIPAGTRWGTVVRAAAPHQLAVPHGSSPTVGAVGYLLRGGLSFYGRKVGLAVNRIRAIEVVTADGELRRVDANHDPELFWALRGGGGGFGVVTAVEIELFPAAAVVTGAAYWPATHAERLLSIWRRWTLDAPAEATTSIRLMNMPVHPAVPEALSAGTMFCVDGAVVAGDGGEAGLREHVDDLLGPLRAVAEPVLDSWHQTTPEAVLEAHMDPVDPVPIVGDHMLLGDIGDEGAAEFLRLTGEGSGSPLIVAGLRQLGGAYATAPLGAGAFARTGARYSYAASAVPFPPLTEGSIRDYLGRVREALAPWDTGQTIPSFVEHFDQPQGHLTPNQVAAADKVRNRVDPDGLFRGDVAPGASSYHNQGDEGNGR
jgi:FAD/FMN-containing dehydrogenase